MKKLVCTLVFFVSTCSHAGHMQVISGSEALFQNESGNPLHPYVDCRRSENIYFNQGMFNENEYFKSNTDGFTRDLPEDTSFLETRSDCHDAAPDYFAKDWTSAYAKTNLKTGELKVYSISNGSNITAYERSGASARMGETLLFKEQQDKDFNVNFDINFEGTLSGNASAYFQIKIGSIVVAERVYFGPESAASCENLNSSYVCNATSIAESFRITANSMTSPYFSNTYQYGHEVVNAKVTSIDMYLHTSSNAVGKALFNNSAWINISADNNAIWTAPDSRFLTTPRANLNSNQVPVGPSASLVLLGLGLLLLRRKTKN